MFSIILDAGHGGTDPGAVYKNYLEKNFNLKIVLTLKKYIEDNYKNIIVYLTRVDDNDYSLKYRYTLSNQLKPSLFISIHCNAGGGTGFESYLREKPSKTEIYYRDVIHDNIVKYNNQFKIANRGKKFRNMDVTYFNLYPAMLLEVLFIDNPNDLKFLLDDEYIKGWCEVVGNGVASIFKLEKKIYEPVSPPIELEPVQQKKVEITTYDDIYNEYLNIKSELEQLKTNISNTFEKIINTFQSIINNLKK
ncbi:MAG: N-acetylmuramoyl-L-alanine amidase [Thermoplasmata archaeon]